MACASLCPAGAVLPAGKSTPGLLFRESSCIQCGLCIAGCPEKALQLNPRMHLRLQRNDAVRCLKEDSPFACIRCGTPFASRTMIETISVRLTGHWMFGTEAEKRRLQMCSKCRVKDVFENQKESGLE